MSFQGRLGNLMCQYGTLVAHANRMGALPVLSDSMKSELLKHFPNLKVPSESELPWCAFEWEDIDINETNQLELGDVMVGSRKICFVKNQSMGAVSSVSI
jgi:hypothetical protein